jgi:hypothetical protein
MGLIRPMGQRGRVHAPAVEGSLAGGCIVATDWRSRIVGMLCERSRGCFRLGMPGKPLGLAVLAGRRGRSSQPGSGSSPLRKAIGIGGAGFLMEAQGA